MIVDVRQLDFVIDEAESLDFVIDEAQSLDFELDAYVNIAPSTVDYLDLIHKPQINGVTLEGNKTTEELLIEGDKFFAFSQMSPASVWHIEHHMKKFPAVTVVDSGGSYVVGDIEYIDDANVTITFQSAFAGKAYLN